MSYSSRVIEKVDIINGVAGVGISSLGVVAYQKANSKPSLISSVAIGSGFLTSAYLLHTNPSSPYGPLAGLISAGVFTGIMGRRLVVNPGASPTSPIAILTGLGLLVGFINFLAWKHRQ